MRQLAQSRSIICVLIGLYLCASLAAIPVPRFVGGALQSDAPSTACQCGENSSCALSDSCCCAAKAMAKVAPAGDRDEPMMLTFGCTPPLKWFLAAVPVFTGSDSVVGIVEASLGEREPVCDLRAVDSRMLEVESPPPKRSA